MTVGPTPTVVHLCRPNHHALGPYAGPTMTNAVSTSLPRWLVRVGPTLAHRSAANDRMMWSIIQRFILKLCITEAVAYCHLVLIAQAVFLLEHKLTDRQLQAQHALSHWICENFTDHWSYMAIDICRLRYVTNLKCKMPPVAFCLCFSSVVTACL